MDKERLPIRALSVVEENPRCRFYLLPKIHKPDIPRPVVPLIAKIMLKVSLPKFHWHFQGPMRLCLVANVILTDWMCKKMHLQVMAQSLQFHIPHELTNAYKDAPQVSIAETLQSPLDHRVSVSACSCLTSVISAFIENLPTLVKTSPSYVKYISHLLNLIGDFSLPSDDENVLLFSMDVKSLYNDTTWWGSPGFEILFVSWFQ